MKNFDEIKMLVSTLPIHEVIMAMPDEDSEIETGTGTGSGEIDP